VTELKLMGLNERKQNRIYKSKEVLFFSDWFAFGNIADLGENRRSDLS
jgi:hypothetical protein